MSQISYEEPKWFEKADNFRSISPLIIKCLDILS